MPKFKKSLDEIETHFEKWLYVLRHLNELDKIPAKLTERVFKKLFDVAEIAKFNREQLMAYEDSMKYYRDIKNSLDTARRERDVAIAKNLLNMGSAIGFVAAATGLTLDEVKTLIGEQN
jgi:PD-(D/E)XK nuclease family transposase